MHFHGAGSTSALLPKLSKITNRLPGAKEVEGRSCGKFQQPSNPDEDGTYHRSNVCLASVGVSEPFHIQRSD